MAFPKIPNSPVKRSVCIVLAALLVLIGLGSAVYLLDPYHLKMAPGVSVDGLDLSGQTPFAAKKTLDQALTDTLYRKTLQIRLPKETISLSPEDLKPKVNVWTLVADAFAIGRGDDTVDSLSLRPYLTVQESAGMAALEAYAAKWDTTLSQTQWVLEGNAPDLATDAYDPNTAQTLTVTLGQPEAHLDVPAAWEQVLGLLDHGISASYSLDIAVIPSALPDDLDLPAIAAAICAEPVNDSLDMVSYQFVPGSYGYTFDDTTLAEQLAKNEYGSTLSVPMEFISPEILGDGVYFRDVLGTCETKHNTNENRNTNLRLLCAALDGHIVQPGEEFSYNAVVGERTAERGYKPAPAYSSGYRLVDSIGGGVCQGSTTLYNCVLLADLEVVFRACHGATVSYVPLGLDAAVNYLTTDFKFRNNWNFPIKLQAEVSDGYVKMKILGTDEKDYYIKMESTYWDEEVATYARSYKCKYSKETDERISREVEAYSSYYKSTE